MRERRAAEHGLAQFDVHCALDTIRKLDFIRVCGSEGERRGMDIVARRLDEIGVGWHYHVFYDKWLEPDDPHLIVRGRKIRIVPAMQLSFHHGLDFVDNDSVCVDLRAELSTVDDCTGRIAVARRFDRQRPIVPGALAQLVAFPFDPEMEPYLWAQQDRDSLHVPVAIVGLADIPLVENALDEPAQMKWSARAAEREFRNLVAEIPGNGVPDEIVVMGAHIDSWPGTVGASDDAAGCAVLTEAARWFAGHPPTRTVRLVWFTGEEVDARGSRRYVSEGVDDARQSKLMVNVDSSCEMGAGQFLLYSSDESTVEWARQRLALDGMEHVIVEAKGLDAGAFIALGIPALGVEAPFKQDAHLPDDSPESIDPDKLQILGSLSLEAAVCAASN